MTEPAAPTPAGRPADQPPGTGVRTGRRGSDRLARRAAGDLASVLRVRAVIALAGALVAAAFAVVVALHATSTAQFGPFIAKDKPVTLTAYSGSWIMGAGGLALLAGLLLVAAVADGYRSGRLARVGRSAHPAR